MQSFNSFEEGDFIYFLNEFVHGIELFEAIRKIGLLQKEDSRFYIASLILCLEYLHKSHIIYRDLKPENVMVMENGYVKLIDFGAAKILDKNENMTKIKTFTLFGTPHYTAPEVMAGNGYTFFADLWSLGICLYELLVGIVPFGEEEDDPYYIYQCIINSKGIEFPSFLDDEKAKSLICQLLSFIPEARLGKSYSSLKNHAWFSAFPWVSKLH